jgi:hypothetical protein
VSLLLLLLGMRLLIDDTMHFDRSKGTQYGCIISSSPSRAEDASYMGCLQLMQRCSVVQPPSKLWLRHAQPVGEVSEAASCLWPCTTLT